MELWCVAVSTTSECTDAVEVALERAGLVGAVIEDGRDARERQARMEYGEWYDDAILSAGARVTAYMARSGSTREVLLDRVGRELDAVRRCGLDAGTLEVTLEALAEDDWLNAWKTDYHALEISPRLAVVPSWEIAGWSGREGQLPLVIDPGVAFGTGVHETTVLCLRALVDLAPGRTVLDVGTGTGILAIAAARLGAARVVALDLDPVAVGVARNNVAQNGVQDAVTVLPSDLVAAVSGTGTFDVVVANLLAGLVERLLPEVSRVMVPGGRLLASGLVESQAQRVADAMRRYGFADIGQQRMADWVLLVGVRSSDDGAVRE